MPRSGNGPHPAESSHPEGVRGLGRERLSFAEELATRGVGGAERRAAIGDLVLTRLAEHWKAVGGPESGAALGAVGGLGRLDSGPASDLDLVLIHDGKSLTDEDIVGLAQRLWYPIWDANIPLDHSVRSLAQCRDVASRDPIAAAGLVDLKHVAGDGELTARAHAAILEDWRATARRHLPDLLASARTRAERFGELAYLTEPNLKESRGGLRDYTTLHALTATWLADRPHGIVDDAALHLLNVRDTLQAVTGGPHVVLTRRVAPTVATRMGYRTEDDLLASLADTGRRISFALDVTERAARYALSQSKPHSRILLAKRRNVAPRHMPVAEGLIEIGADLALSADARPDEDALLPLRVAALSATTGLNPTPGLLDALTRTPDLPEPWPGEALELFLTLLRSPERLLPVWEALDLSGAIVRWLPEWEGVRNRPQRSPVHIYTVDRHSVEAVIQTAPLEDRVENPDLLRLAALFHDLGKRHGFQNHSEDGADLIPGLARRMGLDQATARDLETLVRHHLLLAELATTEDPADPQTLEALLGPLDHRPELFETLRALTEADAIAAGPKPWKPWRQALIGALTERAREALASRMPASR